MFTRLVAITALLLVTGATPVARALFESADPDIEVIAGSYWIFPTDTTARRLVAWESRDLARWVPRGVLLRMSDVAWIEDGAPWHALWAPDMVRAGKNWLLYYSVGPEKPTPSRLGVAVCAAPQGPCRDSGQAILTGGNGFEAIDPAVFVDPRSRVAYLYAGGSAGATLRVFVLSRDMLTLAREVAVDQPRNFTEGAFMHERNGVYYLSYSHGGTRWASYSVHYSTAPSPTGPWTYRGAILTSSARYKGPGHHAFVRDPASGKWLIAYHRWEGRTGKGPYNGFRRVALAPLTYAADGTIEPVVMAEG